MSAASADARMATELAVARALAEAPTLRLAIPRIIEAICQPCDWEVGARQQERSMGIDGLDETTPEAKRGRLDGGFLGVLSALALVADVAGALGSGGLMLRACERAPRLLQILLLLWVLSPFAFLLWTNIVSKRWSIVTRTTLRCVTLFVGLGALAVYSELVVLRPSGSPNAFLFVAVPPASWMFVIIVVAMAALVSGRLSRRGVET